MKVTKRNKLKNNGWVVGSTSDFLGLSDEEEMLINIKLTLASELKSRRQQVKITQSELAKRLGSSQSRVAKMESADSSVSLELLVRSLACFGASQAEIGKMIIGKKSVKKKQQSTMAK